MTEIHKDGNIHLITISGSRGSKVTLSTLGAGVVSIIVPDARGKLADVVLGYANPADYLNDGPCAGKIPGRFANRIGGAHFFLITDAPTVLNLTNHLSFPSTILRPGDRYKSTILFRFSATDLYHLS